MAELVNPSAAGRGLGETQRQDTWWVEIIPVVVLLGGFGIYATLRAFEARFYEWGPYLSPFYSPLIDAHHHWLPPWLSPALLILGGPLGFRVTCYHYRKAYYRAFFLDPPACAVSESRHSYRGETAFPFILQNVHRYFFYLALVFLAFLWRDAVRAFFFDGTVGVGVGTLVLLGNVTLLSIYTLSCHSLRVELSTRDVVARAIYTEVREGRGTEHRGAYLDISQKPAEYVKRKLPSMYHQFLELADVDITKQPMEVGPTCHYVMGGIRVDAETAQASVPGLFAAGEAAAGLHGANRLGGNSLSDLLVFGRRAGLAAARHAKSTAAPSIDSAHIQQAEREALTPFQQKDGESPYAIHRDLQDFMQKLVGIFHNKEDLERSLGEIDKLKPRLKRVSVGGSRIYNPGWHLALDLNSMLTVSEAVALSALAREESRGAHSRIDFSNLDPAWGARNNIIQREGDAMRMRQEKVPEMPGELRLLVADEKGEPARPA